MRIFKQINLYAALMFLLCAGCTTFDSDGGGTSTVASDVGVDLRPAVNEETSDFSGEADLFTGDDTGGGTEGEVCDNGIDDDADGAIDCGDTDCLDHPSCIEGGTELDCDDGLDDDGDGRIDCNDPDCDEAPICNDDEPVFVDEICDNGIDDDGDLEIDCTDPDCYSDPACLPVYEDCFDGVDNDDDGLVDCADPDCASACDGSTSGSADEMICVLLCTLDPSLAELAGCAC